MRFMGMVDATVDRDASWRLEEEMGKRGYM